jgi:hypothetical protein
MVTYSVGASPAFGFHHSTRVYRANVPLKKKPSMSQVTVGAMETAGCGCRATRWRTSGAVVRPWRCL